MTKCSLTKECPGRGGSISGPLASQVASLPRSVKLFVNYENTKPACVHSFSGFDNLKPGNFS